MNGICIQSDTPAETYNVSARIFNNTILIGTHAGYGVWLQDIDTLIFKNNLVLCDSMGTASLYTETGFGYIAHKEIDYNQYYLDGKPMQIDTAYTRTNLYWDGWRALGYDAHSDTGTVSLANKWGTNITDYKLTSNINNGTDLSAYFTTDILGTIRPKGAAWVRGAFEHTP